MDPTALHKAKTAALMRSIETLRATLKAERSAAKVRRRRV
jgi:hypothetical protein